jgi:hypothetical protein
MSKYLLRLGLPVLLLLSTGITWLVYQQPKSTVSSPVTQSVSTADRATTPVVSDEQSTKPKANQLPHVKSGRSDDNQSAEAVVARGPEAKYEPSITETGVTENGKLHTEEGIPLSGGASGPTATTKPITPTNKAVTKEHELIDHSGIATSATTANASSNVDRNGNRSLAKSTNGKRNRTARKVADANGSLFTSSGSVFPNERPSQKRRLTASDNEPAVSVSTALPGEQPIAVAETAEPVALLSIAELAGKPATWSKPLLTINRDVIAKPDTMQRMASHKPSLPVQKGLSVRFVVSPDLSTIGLHDFSRPGTNVGLMLEYRLASRWSVQAGVLRSTKVYRASTDYYELPAYTKTWTVLPEGVSGRCNMIDIPINLRYDVLLRPAANGKGVNRWFVTGGATSYIMRQEDYDYEYADPTNPHIYADRRGWHGNTGAYGLSQLNMSVGYERAFSRRLSWQIEPFMKMPLKKVGYYKLDLLSTGVFFSLRYKL